jgi:hypothetical protein
MFGAHAMSNLRVRREVPPAHDGIVTNRDQLDLPETWGFYLANTALPFRISSTTAIAVSNSSSFV